MSSSSTDFFSPPLFSPFSFCPCSLLLFFFLLSRSPHCLLLFFSVFSPFLFPFSSLCTGFVWCCCSRWFTVAASPLQTKKTVWKGCSTNTASSPPVVSSVFFFAVPFLLLLFFLLTVTSPLSFLPPSGSVPPLAFIARGRRCFVVTAGMHHSGKGCQPLNVLLD